MGTNPLGMVFIVTYGALFALQFVCMLVHRFNTLVQFIATLSLAGNMVKSFELSDRHAARLDMLTEIRYEGEGGGRDSAAAACPALTLGGLLYFYLDTFKWLRNFMVPAF